MTKLYGAASKQMVSSVTMIAIFSIVILVEVILIRKAIQAGREKPDKLHIKRAAEKLYQMTKRINQELDGVCLGEESCGTCAGAGCLLGYIRIILTQARRDNDYFLNSDIHLEDLLVRDYKREKIEDALLLTLQELMDYGWTDEPEFIMTKVRESLEILAFQRKIHHTGSLEEYLNEVSTIDYQLGKRYENILQREAANEKKDN
jgi:hypothetical protein